MRRFSDQKTSKTLDERGDLKEEEFSEYEFVVFGEQDSADIRGWSGDRLKNNDTQEMVWGQSQTQTRAVRTLAFSTYQVLQQHLSQLDINLSGTSKAKNTDAQTW